MPQYSTLPTPIKIVLNILGFIFIFLSIQYTSPLRYPLEMLVLFFLALSGFTLIQAIRLESTFHIGIITTLILCLLSDFRFFVVLLSTCCLFFFIKTFTADSYLSYEKQFKNETNKKLKAVIHSKISEYKSWEKFLISISVLIFYYLLNFFLAWSYQKGELSALLVSQQLVIGIFTFALCLATLERKFDSIS